jgi:hypothetical protein
MPSATGKTNGIPDLHSPTLEDRIQVLERIITDSSSRDDLRRQFRDLER